MAARLVLLTAAAAFPLVASAAQPESLVQGDDLLANVYPPAVREVVEQRCVVCHGCYDAPCQLKLDAWAGLARGAHEKKVYDGTRLIAAELTRLYEDATDLQGWRAKGFFPVLHEAAPKESLVYRMLALKEEYPLPTRGRLSDDFDFRLNRDQSCPSDEEFADYREQRPFQGMPYGFPGLDPARLHTLTDWLERGAPGVVAAPPSAAEQQSIDSWEAFLNGQSNKEQLMSRYIFEHLFIGGLYFDELSGERNWYSLVRSRTPPGQPIRLIATRRPYDSPGDDAFYYRLQRRHLTPLAKRHMPYALNPGRMQRWRELFLTPDYAVDALPGYDGKDSANPFVVFEQLPVNARYRFMLEEAQFTIMAYIKGPVCRGQVALNVIDDHFWVAFAKPNALDPEQSAAFLARHAHEMRLPQAKGSLVVTLLQWRKYAKSQRRFLQAQAQAIASVIEQDALRLDLDLIWDGDGGRNDNAALTIFRHIDSASVVKGFVGQTPKTMWVIDYSLLERIHYLLVAGFDVYGAVGHQLESRLYMDFLRMEGEQAFLLFLPEDERLAVRNYWYRGARDHVRNYLVSPKTERYERPTAISYSSADARSELMQKLRRHIPSAISPRYRVQAPALRSLMDSADASFSFLPEVAFLQIIDARGERSYYSLIHNQAFSNNAQLFQEHDRRLPDEDTLTVARGFIGAYPNVFFQIAERELPHFTAALRNLTSEADYAALVTSYGVRRTAPWFWKLSDDMHGSYAERFPAEAGLFDLNRYENR